jgi:hypothetical protein
VRRARIYAICVDSEPGDVSYFLPVDTNVVLSENGKVVQVFAQSDPLEGEPMGLYIDMQRYPIIEVYNEEVPEED